MSSINVTISNNGPDPKSQLALVRAAIVEGVVEGVTEAADVLRRFAVQAVTDLGRVDKGTLRNSIRVEIIRTPTVVRAIVSADAPYAQWVEFGRRGQYGSYPGIVAESAQAAWPPVDVIRKWVRSKYRELTPSGRTKSGKARRPKAADVNAVAFLVGRKIYQRGIRPSPFMRPALAATKPLLPGIIQRNVLRRLAAVGPTTKP